MQGSASVAGNTSTRSADDPALVEAEYSVGSPASADVSMDVAVLNGKAPARQSAEGYAQDGVDAENVVDVSAFEFGFSCNGEPLDVSACDVSATITPNGKLQAAADAIEAPGDAADDAEVGVVVAALQSAEGAQSEKLGSVMVEKGASERPAMTLSLDGAAPALQLVARSALNPHFTVQYYANLEIADRDPDGYLTIVDTDNGGNCEGGNLPSNGTDPDTAGLYLVDAGNGKREIRTKMQLTELYEANEYDYFDAPSLPYVNIFRSNGNYTANEVWVLNEGADPSSTDEGDWTVRKGVVAATELHFTNNPDRKDDPDTVYIQDGAVIRLVANQTEGEYDNAAMFYDYDITEDGEHTWVSGEGAKGINNPSNYPGDGWAQLAFGNANTGTGMHWEDWRGNTPNQNNRSGNGYKGCTFGLVTGLDEDGHIVYASGIDAPNLFDEGSATGKTAYDDYSLGFNRSGDTYTLSSVNGAGLDGLEYFNNPAYPTQTHTGIWTNNFWPMDGVENADPHTGTYDTAASGHRGVEHFIGIDGDSTYPPSDDGVAHNNMFGMQYSVEFELTEDYVGPLEYYFFGDDDMWVFLDGELVCDIGGVHSSVGAYVNLWDYIEKGDAGKHTLKFYYTERGLSGSTCYMQFTLPSVSSVTPTYQNGQLKIEKEVVGEADPEAEFSFGISISSDDGLAEGSDYAIVRYSPDGQRIESSLLSGGTGAFKLKADEYVLIDYLQHGTHYTIEETNADGFVVSVPPIFSVRGSATRRSPPSWA